MEVVVAGLVLCGGCGPATKIKNPVFLCEGRRKQLRRPSGSGLEFSCSFSGPSPSGLILSFLGPAGVEADFFYFSPRQVGQADINVDLIVVVPCRYASHCCVSCQSCLCVRRSNGGSSGATVGRNNVVGSDSAAVLFCVCVRCHVLGECVGSIAVVFNYFLHGRWTAAPALLSAWWWDATVWDARLSLAIAKADDVVDYRAVVAMARRRLVLTAESDAEVALARRRLGRGMLQVVQFQVVQFQVVLQVVQFQVVQFQVVANTVGRAAARWWDRWTLRLSLAS